MHIEVATKTRRLNAHALQSQLKSELRLRDRTISLTAASCPNTHKSQNKTTRSNITGFHELYTIPRHLAFKQTKFIRTKLKQVEK